MRYAAWEARLAKPHDDGQPTRAHLAVAASKGSPFAIAHLRVPAFPEELEYLWDWFQSLRRGLSESFTGARLTWDTLRAWMTCTETRIEPYEADALFALDAATRNPDAPELA